VLTLRVIWRAVVGIYVAEGVSFGIVTILNACVIASHPYSDGDGVPTASVRYIR
jgi:hypothetical protein